MERKIFIVLIFLLFYSGSFSWAQEKANSTQETGYEKFINYFNFYDRLMNYLREEKKTVLAKEYQPAILPPPALLISIALDLFLSGSCLWLAMWFLFRKRFDAREYLWFIFIVNFAWLLVLFLFKGLWKILDVLVIRLQPDVEGVILDKFSDVAIVTAILIFIWLLARTFKLHFRENLQSFFISQPLYFIIIFALSLYLAPLENSLKLAVDNLGIKTALRAYYQEVNQAIYGKELFLLVRFRGFHL